MTDNIIFMIGAVWLAVVTVLLIYYIRFLRKLTKGSKESDLKKVLDKILAREVINSQDIGKLDKRASMIEDAALGHIQKVAMVRFNPFEETGGDHSFSIALLNDKDTGIILTGLHTRERTRVYAKTIKNAKSDIELSQEEKKVLTKAQKNK